MIEKIFGIMTCNVCNEYVSEAIRILMTPDCIEYVICYDCVKKKLNEVEE